MRKPALVVSDLDGTLIKPNTAALEPRTLELIEGLLDAGIPFMPASGRQHPNVRWLFEPLAERLSFVSENGVLAHIGDELVYRATLERDLGLEIVRTILERPNCEPMVSGEKTYYITPESPRSCVISRRAAVSSSRAWTTWKTSASPTESSRRSTLRASATTASFSPVKVISRVRRRVMPTQAARERT